MGTSRRTRLSVDDAPARRSSVRDLCARLWSRLRSRVAELVASGLPAADLFHQPGLEQRPQQVHRTLPGDGRRRDPITRRESKAPVIPQQLEQLFFLSRSEHQLLLRFHVIGLHPRPRALQRLAQPFGAVLQPAGEVLRRPVARHRALDNTAGRSSQ